MRSGALVDVIHGTSMSWLACVETQRRKAALVDAGMAFAFAAGGVTAAREDVGALAEWQPKLPSRIYSDEAARSSPNRHIM